MRGTHGLYRPVSEAQSAFREDVPLQVKALGVDGIEAWLSSRDYSHVVSRANGGSNYPSNLIFENRGWNRARGSADMGNLELIRARADNLSDIFKNPAFRAQLLKAGVRGSQIGALQAALWSACREGLSYQRGERDLKSSTWRVAQHLAWSGLSGAALGIAIAVLTVLFPPFGSALWAISPALRIASYMGIAVQIAEIIYDRWQFLQTASSHTNPRRLCTRSRPPKVPQYGSHVIW